MTKNEFLTELTANLSPLSSKDKNRTISYYEELIDDQLESGKTESEIIENLEAPEVIASKIKAELSQKEKFDAPEEQTSTISKSTKSWIIVAIILGFPIWFSLLASVFAVVVSVFAAIFAVVVSLFVSVVAFGIYGIVQIIACVFYFSISSAYAFSILGMGLVAVGASILVYFASIALGKLAIKFTIWFANQTKKWFASITGGKNGKKN